MIHTFHVYAQHTARAGQRCYDDDLIERESDAVFEISGTPAELREMAGALEKQSSRYAWAQAHTVRDVLAEAAQDGNI